MPGLDIARGRRFGARLIATRFVGVVWRRLDARLKASRLDQMTLRSQGLTVMAQMRRTMRTWHQHRRVLITSWRPII